MFGSKLARCALLATLICSWGPTTPARAGLACGSYAADPYVQFYLSEPFIQTTGVYSCDRDVYSASVEGFLNYYAGQRFVDETSASQANACAGNCEGNGVLVYVFTDCKQNVIDAGWTGKATGHALDTNADVDEGGFYRSGFSYFACFSP